jgi:hypothetical protein
MGSVFVALVVYGVVAGGLVYAVVRLCGDDGGEAQSTEPRTVERPCRHAVLRPVLLTFDDQVVVLDGVLGDGSAGNGAPIALAMQLPQTAWFALVVRDVLERWVDHDDVIDVDLSKLRKAHPSIGLSAGDCRVRLDVASGSGSFGSGPAATESRWSG